MRDEKNFYEVLEKFIEQDGRRVRQISRASGFDGHFPVPHVTINRWKRGHVKKPRDWQELVKLAIALNLTESEADELLMSACHRPIAELQEIADCDSDRKLLSHWDKKAQPFQVPPDLPYFTGRQAELDALKEAIRHKAALLCLQGMGGAGKTTLAIHLAYELREDFPDGVLWAQLEQSEPMSVLHSFADAYGYDVTKYTDLGSRGSKVRQLLADKRLLIVLDNAECDSEVRPLLPPTTKCAVIITTRRHDLSVADRGLRFNIGPFSKEKKEGLALFARILGKEPRINSETVLSEIADLLGHLPLAIAITANRMKHERGWSAAYFLTRVCQEQRRLTELARGDQGVGLSFDFSYNALPPHLQDFFIALGVLEGKDFSVDGAAYVAALSTLEAEDYLRKLHCLSLVQPAQKKRYKLHPLLRDYSRQKSTELSVHSSRMVTFFVDYIVLHKKNYAALDEEISNLFAALEIAFEQDMKANLVRGASSFYPFLQARGQYEQAKFHLERAEQAAREIGDLAELATVQCYRGRLANKQGEYCKAKELYQKALTLARQMGKQRQISSLLTSLGALAHRQGHCSEAKGHYEEAMSLARQTGEEARIAALLTNLGVMATERGDYDQAELSYQQALLLTDKVHQKRLFCTLLQNLGQLYYERGDYAQAREYFQEGFSRADQIGDPELMSRMLGNLGLVAIALGNHAEAAAYIRRGLSLAEKSGIALQISRQLANLGLVESARRNYNQANLHYEEALVTARQNGFPLDISVILNQWGECHFAQKNWREAGVAFYEALQTAQNAKNFQIEVATSLYGLARIAAIRGNVPEARQFGEQSQLIFATIGHRCANELKWWLAELPGVVVLSSGGALDLNPMGLIE